MSLKRAIDKFHKRKLFFFAPQLEEFRLALKWPAFPKVVILPTNNPVFDNILNRQFSQFGKVDAKLLAERTTSELTQFVAQQLYEVSAKNDGALLYNYPNNPEEAHNLDLLLDGVNIAVNLRLSKSLQSKVENSYQACKTCGQVFNTELGFISPTTQGFDLDCESTSKCELHSTTVQQNDVTNQAVVNYYAEKGLLLDFEINEDDVELNEQQFQEKLRDTITSAIKL